MATLTVASRANPALTLPAVLAAAYARGHGIPLDVTYENVDLLTSGPVELVTLNGRPLAGDDILDYFHDILPGCQTNQREHSSDRLTQIIGYSITLADVAIWGALRGNRVIVGLRRKSPNVNRWFNFVESRSPWVIKAVDEFNSQTQVKKASGANYNIGLKNVENGIVCRFPPEPSGYLHIGHAKAALLNDYFAHQHGNARGLLICRFDDTNPSKESQEFMDAIIHDLSLLGISPDRVTYSSDYFRQMYEACREMIQSRKAYADNTTKEVMQDQRMKGIPSTCRNMSIEESLFRFEEMKSGSPQGLKWCIRAKISTDNPNKALRDPVIYRYSIEQVTHALRTNEYRDRNAQYRWMQEALGLRKVDIWDFSRLSFVRTVLSKRKLTAIVDSGVVWGWDDPRMPTVRGIRRRGCTIAALREFILEQGPSQNIVNMDWTRFWAMNKKHIDPVAARYTAIPKVEAVTALVDGIEMSMSAEKLRHKNRSLGTKTVVFNKEILIGQADARLFEENERITLMNWGNAVIDKIGTSSQTGKISSLRLRLDLTSDVKTTDKKITWLAKEAGNLIPAKLYTFNHLLMKDKLEKDDDLTSCLTIPSERCTEAWADCNVSRLAEDDIIQFDRIGYFRVDRAYRGGDAVVLFNIPTGKGT
ncbi:hypothetical protein BDV38DRAFT_268059 [Aspergillus pseudotamarii]|uniref:tRNA synthetases class I, catalytic domain-containing protein n=1 Tax=Aspergillus pseudotamarii TaxID=132259 RepID=A0A5N6T7P8_ASPPS|nr:uncharacterized protein BDV38DRAFT_268059 [Aspergillus pseudotamarii]KAE8142363.1 hypothetical protein BDV38DRAFT_268059 [Aspergillus pseudotamarii]